jgi:hypothetical protein
VTVSGQRYDRLVTAQPTDPVPGPEELDELEATGRTGKLTDQQARELLSIPGRRGDEGDLTTDEVRRRLGLLR